MLGKYNNEVPAGKDVITFTSLGPKNYFCDIGEVVIRETEGGTACPSNIKTWRAAVRTKANAMQVQIDGAADVDALAALYVYTYADPDDSTSAFTRPLGEFPTL